MQHYGHHHLHVRKRVHKHLEPYPSKDILKRWFDRFMYVVAIGGPLSVLPQIIQTFETRDVSGLSLSTWILWEVLTIVWLLYGFLHKEAPIIVSQSIYLIFNGIIIAAILFYG